MLMYCIGVFKILTSVDIVDLHRLIINYPTVIMSWSLDFILTRSTFFLPSIAIVITIKPQIMMIYYPVVFKMEGDWDNDDDDDYDDQCWRYNKILSLLIN